MAEDKPVRMTVTLTGFQTYLIDMLLESGLYGTSRAEVVRRIIDEYMHNEMGRIEKVEGHYRAYREKIGSATSEEDGGKVMPLKRR